MRCPSLSHLISSFHTPPMSIQTTAAGEGRTPFSALRDSLTPVVSLIPGMNFFPSALSFRSFLIFSALL